MGDLYNEAKLSQPLKEVEEKWKLVPAFLRLRGLVKQHIDSYNYFINVDLKKIIQAEPEILCAHEPNFMLKFTDIQVGMPTIEEDCVVHSLMPQECRVRDLTYSAPILVSVKYVKGEQLVQKNNVPIGRIPVMLGASNCWLAGKSQEQLSAL